MAKEFYTEKDIEDLAGRGIKSLTITEHVVLTELAYEKANRLGVQLLSDRADNPPAAPVRPYLSEARTLSPRQNPVKATQPDPALHHPAVGDPSARGANDIEKRIRSAVLARLGNQVDAALLDNIIHRVVKSVGLK
jgi:hypothetical protein